MNISPLNVKDRFNSLGVKKHVRFSPSLAYNKENISFESNKIKKRKMNLNEHSLKLRSLIFKTIVCMWASSLMMSINSFKNLTSKKESIDFQQSAAIAAQDTEDIEQLQFDFNTSLASLGVVSVICIYTGKTYLCDQDNYNPKQNKKYGDILNFLAHGPRLDKNLDNLELDIDGTKVSVWTDNDIVSEEYAAQHNYTKERKILSKELIKTLKNNLKRAKKRGLEIPEQIYITDMFGDSNDRKYTQGKYRGGFEDIFLNIGWADTAKQIQYLFGIPLYHELGHLTDDRRIDIDSKNLYTYIMEKIKNILPKSIDKDITLDDGSVLTLQEITDCISHYATTNNAEFIAEVVTDLMQENIVQNSDGKYLFAGKKKKLNKKHSAALQKVMRYYNTLTQGKILQPVRV